LETIIPGVTGELFGVEDVAQGLALPDSMQATGLRYKDQIKNLLLSWNPQKYSLDNLCSHAEKFSKNKFKENLKRFILDNTNENRG
jgi:hypothetical protein